jgi:eukaryotic-like serine/threonine-protein kinase
MHELIVRVFDANIFEGPSGNCGYFTMENVPGGSLDKFWRSFGSSFIPVETTADLVKQVCRGLGQAHQEKPPIIHRDIKPQNILVGYEADGLRARVSDFGLAKKVNPLTLLATAAGTLQFKPPEAFAQHKADSPAADVWAIGMTLYLLLTDRLPVEMPDGTTWTTKHLFDQPIIPPTEVNPDISRGLEKVVMRALDKSPEKRFPTARELLHALDAAPLHDEPGPAPRKSLSSEPTKAVLGNPSPMDGTQARSLVDKALEARRGGRLGEAADLMEEAFNKSPELRGKYARQVKLWRCGISM